MTLRTIWAWISKYIKLILSGFVVIGSVIVAVGWHLKNKKIDDLQYQLAISQAKFRIEALASAYKVTIAELNELRKQDLELDKQIATVEKFLDQKLQGSMTADEIVQKFKEIGIEPIIKNVADAKNA